MMKIFFDTEFTGLHKGTTLISIGLVSEDGRIFYAELNDYDRSQCNDWIKEHVLSNLDNAGCDKNELRKRLTEWIGQFDAVELVSDVCHYDMVLFIDIFGTAFDIPSNVSPSCHDINQDIAKYYNISEREAFDKSREDIVGNEVDGNKHNALYDAMVIKAIYNKINKPII